MLMALCKRDVTSLKNALELRLLCIDPSPLSAAYMRQWIRSALVQIVPCRLFGAKPLSKPVLVYCQLDPSEQTSVELLSKCKTFHSRKCIWMHCLWHGDHLWVQPSMCTLKWEDCHLVCIWRCSNWQLQQYLQWHKVRQRNRLSIICVIEALVPYVGHKTVEYVVCFIIILWGSIGIACSIRHVYLYHNHNQRKKVEFIVSLCYDTFFICFNIASMKC